MPSSRPSRPRTKAQAQTYAAQTPEAAGRLLGELADQVARQQIGHRSIVVADLVVGANRINHGLGRRPKFVQVMPTTADASFAWGVSVRTETQIVIDVIGVAQANAAIEIA